MGFDVVHEHLSDSTFGRVFRLVQHQPRLTAVTRAADLTPQEFVRSFASQSLPVVLEGFVPTAITEPREATRLLDTAIGRSVVTVRHGDYADPDKYRARRLTTRMTVSRFLADLESDRTSVDHCYLANQELPRDAIEALGIHSPPYYAESDLRAPRMWLGPSRCVTPLHKDGTDNFSLQVFGTKRWVLFPVRDYPLLYFRPPEPTPKSPGFSCSQVDFGKPDHDRFPLYRYAGPVAVECNAGDTLYLPAGWSHYVETVSTAFTVNYWLRDERRGPACLEGR